MSGIGVRKFPATHFRLPSLTACPQQALGGSFSVNSGAEWLSAAVPSGPENLALAPSFLETVSACKTL